MKKILGVGNALVDILVTLPDDKTLETFGLAKGSMQLVDNSLSSKIINHISSYNPVTVSGGSASNTIHGLSKLGMTCSFIGKTSDDEFGNVFKEDLLKNSINPMLFKGNLETGRAVALITPDSERTFATYLGSAVTLSPEEITPAVFKGHHYIHVEGYLVQNHALIEKILKTAKESGLIVSLDLASFNIVTENLEFLHEIAKKHVDILFANETEALSFTGADPVESAKIISGICKVGVVKTGPKGSTICCGNELCSVDSVEASPIDTTGAGDLYASGFLYGYMNGLPLKKCAEYGSLLASKVIERIGAKIPDSDWDKLVEELQKV
ncbi:MAG: adenosine kinase [bacterium]